MKKPMVDYRQFRLSKLNTPEFSHLKLLGGWIVYFILYFLTENLIPPERCHVVHSALDDAIPFLEGFAIPYCFWFLLIVISLGFFLLYDVDSFKRLQVFIMITQAVAMAVYILWPNRQDLRPESFEHRNFCTAVLSFLYAFDTPTGVCPSLHVAYSLGILSVALKDRDLNPWFKAALGVFVLMVCMAVCFVKQHSSIDVVAALPVCLIAELAVYGRDYWKPRWNRLFLRPKKKIA